MPNRTYRGPGDRQPKTITDRTCNGALLPCTGVFVSGYQLDQATSATGGRLALLGARDWISNGFSSSDPLKEPYEHGETGEAYVLEPGQTYRWAMAAGSYTSGQPLTVGPGGRLAAAGSSPVVAYFDSKNMTLLAGDLADVVIA